MANPPVDVQQFGQSIWIDNIQRKLLEDGTFQRLIDENGVMGVTSNPSIFQKAIGSTTDYDDGIMAMLELEPETIYEKLAVEDIQRATDLFRPIYDRTDGKDGYVSLEVSPLIAHNTAETISEARRLFDTVGRPNVMIKIPATREGIPAIEESIAAGINVNVTLIFAVENYVEVAEAFIRGLERRMEAGQDVSKVASVASFFLSRIDTMVDRMLENNIHAAKMTGDISRVQANNRLLGLAAISNARIAYDRFKRLFYGPRFAKLREAGAQVQRPLWASTGTKNPTYSDTKYVDNLIGKDTVNTLPPATLDAFKDHGRVNGETILDDLRQANEALDMLAEVGIDMAQITQRLQDDGVEAFIEAFEDLIAQVSAKRTILGTGIIGRQKIALGIYAEKVQQAQQQLTKIFFNARMWHKDGSLWKDHPPTMTAIENRLGWLDVLQTINLDLLKKFQAEIKSAGFEQAVLLGMGGSSLAPEVLFNTFGKQEGFPSLLVLDSTHPAQIKMIEDAITLDKTLFIVASKSGGTLETHSFYKYFFNKVKNGDQFIAITDEGSQLAGIAQENNFRATFINPSDIGGRYSALSYFGMVPAAIIGLDLDKLWHYAKHMIDACNPDIPDDKNPGLVLGCFMGALGLQNRDKIGFFASDPLASFGNWVEQLIAESVGKEGKGLVPVVGATVGLPHDYATDRQFIYLKLEGAASNATMDEGIRVLREAGHPRVTLIIDDLYAIAGEFFRFEYATAVAGQMLRINPFDEPNVTESKENTRRLLEYYQENGELPQMKPYIAGENTEVYADEHTLAPLRELCTQHGYDSHSRREVLAAQITGTNTGDYFAFLVYLPQTETIDNLLNDARRRLRHTVHRAVTVGYGPRYLHSTGQLHKGGPNNGVYFVITGDHTTDMEIPDAPYSFATLNDAQAIGDIQSLQAHKRRVIRLHLKGDVHAGLHKLLEAIDFVEERRK